MKTGTRSCDCKWCTVEFPAMKELIALVKAHGTEKNAAFLEKTFTDLMYASEGEAYWKAKYLGQWPGDEWLAKEHKRRAALTPEQLEEENEK